MYTSLRTLPVTIMTTALIELGATKRRNGGRSCTRLRSELCAPINLGTLGQLSQLICSKEKKFHRPGLKGVVD